MLNFFSFDAIAPQQIERFVDLCEISVSQNLCPDRVLSILDSMKIISYHIDEISSFNTGLDIEVLKILNGEVTMSADLSRYLRRKETYPITSRSGE